MRLLFLCTKYPVASGDTYMTSELAAALKRAGHEVDVMLLDWDAPLGSATERIVHDGIDVLRIAPRAWQQFGTFAYRASKFVLSDRHAVREMKRHLRLDGYDACVAWTPALTLAGPIALARRRGIARRVLFIFDFFPIHHREIGMVPPGPPFWVAMRAEERAMAQFTAIICNLPGNIDYLKRRYRLAGQRLSATPLWSDTSIPDVRPRSIVRAHYGLPADRPIAIFGGQITDGRGIELMLDAAAVSHAKGSEVLYLFVGNGRLVDKVVERQQKADNVRHLAGVLRDEYLSVVAACDVGLVATVPGVSSFSFPTKTIDYLRAGIPVVAAVEPGSDYLDIVTSNGVGHGAAFDDPTGFAAAVDRCLTDQNLRETIRTRSVQCLDSVFDVRHTVEALLAATAD